MSWLTLLGCQQASGEARQGLSPSGLGSSGQPPGVGYQRLVE